MGSDRREMKEYVNEWLRAMDGKQDSLIHMLKGKEVAQEDSAAIGQVMLRSPTEDPPPVVHEAAILQAGGQL